VRKKTTPETQHRQDSPEDKVFEQLLASKIRVDIKEKKERAAKEREMLTSFLPTHRKVGGLYVLETIEGTALGASACMLCISASCANGGLPETWPIQ